MLEVKIEELTKAVIALTELIGKIEAGKSEPLKNVYLTDPKPAKAAKIEVPVTEAEIVKESPVAPVMPAAPTFEPVVEAAPVANCPITDGKSLIDYVMTVYKELGPEKGAKIQGVLTEMGLQNVNELRPTEYDAFYSKVEALKG